LEHLDQSIKNFMTPIITYDEKGVRIGSDRSISIFNPNSSISRGRNVDIYDEKGRLKEEKKQILTDEGEATVSRVHEYEQKGEMTEDKIFMFNKTFPDEIRTYNSNGHITSRKKLFYYTGGQEIAFWEITQYDGNGRVAEIKNFNRDGTQDRRAVLTYYPDGRIKERMEYGRDGALRSKTITSYEPETELTYKPDGSVEYKVTRNYEYDLQGNWIRKTERTVSFEELHSDNTRITTRTISYYPAK